MFVFLHSVRMEKATWTIAFKGRPGNTQVCGAVRKSSAAAPSFLRMFNLNTAHTMNEYAIRLAKSMAHRAEQLLQDALILRDAVDHYIDVEEHQRQALSSEVSRLIDILDPLDKKYRK